MSEKKFETAKAAYAWCLENKVISQRVAEVYQALCDGMSAMNQAMVHQAVIVATGKVGLERYSCSPRFSVLLRMGLIRVTGKGPCPVTGRQTVFYEPTLARPVMTEAEAYASAMKRENAAELRRELEAVKKENAQLNELLNLRSASFHEREARIAATPLAIQPELFAT